MPSNKANPTCDTSLSLLNANLAIFFFEVKTPSMF
jgi:hypothetical protein